MTFPATQSSTWLMLWSLRWRHNGRDSVSNHQPHLCLLNRLFRRRSKKTPKLRVTGICVGNSPVNSRHKWLVTWKMFPFDDVTGDRWIPRTNGQLRGKCFHLMTSSWINNVPANALASFGDEASAGAVMIKVYVGVSGVCCRDITIVSLRRRSKTRFCKVSK